MKSGTLTKPSGSLYDDEQLFWMSLGILGRGERVFLLKSITEAQRKLGHYNAGSCFHHNSSAVLWILVIFGTYETLFSGGIQRHRLQEIWRRTRSVRRELAEVSSAGEIRQVGAC